MAPHVRQPRHPTLDTTAPEAFRITIHPDRVAAFYHNASRKMEATRYFVDDDIRALRIYDETVRLFANIGWASLFMCAWKTYQGPTLGC